jgi:hypothetical protein
MPSSPSQNRSSPKKTRKNVDAQPRVTKKSSPANKGKKTKTSPNNASAATKRLNNDIKKSRSKPNNNQTILPSTGLTSKPPIISTNKKTMKSVTDAVISYLHYKGNGGVEHPTGRLHIGIY